MTSKERVLAAIHHTEPDRVPIDYLANPEINEGLWRHFGLQHGDGEGLRQALGVDFRVVGPRYIGPPMPDLGPDWRQGLWGTRLTKVGHGTGAYWDYGEWLLKDAQTPEEIDAFPWHLRVDQFDFSVIPQQIEQFRDYCIVLGSPGVPDLLNGSGMVLHPERVLLGLGLDDPVLLRLFDIRTAFWVECAARSLEAAQGGIDLFWMGEDLGSQRGPLLSLDMFRKYIKPRHAQVIEVAKSHDLPVMLHSCGSTYHFMPELLSMGINVMDTLQPEAADMQPAKLKAEYGDQLAFHGMISTAGSVAYGTVDDVVSEVTETLETMMPGGGYCLCPTHSLQSNSPIENVVAMYETARRVGVYG